MDALEALRNLRKPGDAYGVAKLSGMMSPMEAGRALVNLAERGLVKVVEPGGGNCLATTYKVESAQR